MPDGVLYQADGLRLLRGDCRALQEPDNSVDLVITDPPFNISGSSGRRNFDYGQGADADDLPPEEYLEFTKQWVAEALRVLKPGGQLYALMPGKWLPWWSPILKEMTWWILPWVKTMAFLHRHNTYLRAWEPILWLVKGKSANVLRRSYRYQDDKDWVIGPSAVGESEGAPLKKKHPTPRPDWLYEYFIIRASRPGMTVLDPMMGSGTGGRVARRLGRRFVGYDINPDYVDLAQQIIADVEFGMPLEVLEEIDGYGQLELLSKWNGAGLSMYPVEEEPWLKGGLRLAGLSPEVQAAVLSFITHLEQEEAMARNV